MKTRIIKWLLLPSLWITAHVLYTIVDGLYDKGEKADVAVILGNKVNEDGTLSKRLEKRLETGLGLYLKGRVKKIIVSGGLGREGYYEGDKMKEYLLLNGVVDSAIVVDNQGNTTMLTIDNTLKMQNELRFKSILVVSQYYHVTRTKMLFKRRHLKNVASVSPCYFEFRDAYSLLREFPAFYSQLW